MKPEIVVNQNEREAFLSSIKDKRYAGIEQVRCIYRTMSLSAHRREFINNKRGFRDGHRAALFLEVTQLKNAEAAVMAFFISLSQMGFRGAVCPEDVLSAQIIESTGAKCAPRTFRRALASLCVAGWLDKRSLATGSKVPKPGGGWVTLQVNRITIPRCTFLLGSRKSPVSPRVTPRPKGPAIRELNPTPSRGSGLVLVVNSKNKSKVRNEESKLTSATHSTPSPSPTSPPLKHQTVKPEGRTKPATGSKASHEAPTAPVKKPPKRAVHPFGRKARSKISNTWKNSRELFLHDLQTAGASEFELKTARTQTDLRYPPMLPNATDWDSIIPRWLESEWKDRRREITRDILPALAAWCRPLVAPDPAEWSPNVSPERRAKGLAQREQFSRVSKIMKSLPEMIISDDTPDFVREMISEKSWTLSTLPALLAKGILSLDDISQEDYADFDKIAALVNMSD